ncbi:universal stress protein [Corynebacterium liangguodongii]|uniref:Universal stress protein n=1 Tax=Corynebacterium liangguodongii TaxID=2079535 RepID=A0A2S0WDX7_9CORY|nr:universal stress protein [Corynebacterium liangguodongii]AWB83934.1 universal stress protein [Corynebacterium liangguodongii]PWB99073.1 universal stress protein [Corynebacterium liangguodongii]
MSDDYSTIVVGTDGSESSLLAVAKAARLAAALGAKLVIATAYYLSPEDAASANRSGSATILGDAQARANLAQAREHALGAGAHDVSVAAREGTPVEALVGIVSDVEADLLVVGNRGINTLTGRLLGSVPADVARQSDCDVMIVHTVS